MMTWERFRPFLIRCTMIALYAAVAWWLQDYWIEYWNSFVRWKEARDPALVSKFRRGWNFLMSNADVSRKALAIAVFVVVVGGFLGAIAIGYWLAMKALTNLTGSRSAAGWSLALLIVGHMLLTVADRGPDKDEENWWLGVFCVASALILVSWRRVVLIAARRSKESSVGVVVTGEWGGFPRVSWTQETGTGRTMGHLRAYAERQILLALTCAGAVVGFFFGEWEGAMTGAFFGFWLGALTPETGHFLNLSSVGGGAPPSSRPVSENDRRVLASAEVCIEDCDTFIAEEGDELFFCVARGDKSKGPLAVVERVPWSNLTTSFDNFEVGSHREWFRSRSAPDNLPDWDVIIAQARQPRLVKVAESVNDHASMVELLALLQTSFTGRKRDEIVTAWKRAKDEANREAAGHSGDADGVPTKPF